MSEDQQMPKSGSSVGKSALIAVVVTLIAGGGYYFYSYQSEVKALTTPSGIGQGGASTAPKKSIDEQIKDIEADKSIPAGFKMMALQRLKGQKAAEEKAAKEAKGGEKTKK